METCTCIKIRENEDLLRYYVCDTIVFCGKYLTLTRNEIMFFFNKKLWFLVFGEEWEVLGL